MSNAMILYQEYRNFFERKNTEVLIHTASFEEASDVSQKNIKDTRE
ncbi:MULTISPECIES: hypothetical protein [unclassified Lactobacillus]|nr:MULTISPECIES: hypothetical protein [unclassified Lactobacillus]